MIKYQVYMSSNILRPYSSLQLLNLWSIQEQDQFAVPNNSVEYETSEKRSIFSADTWAKYFNPAEWFNGIGSWHEGIIMAVTIAGILICLGIIAKICYMVGCVVSCCSCLGRCCCRRKQKAKVEKDPKGRGVNRSRPDTLKLMKSPPSNREPSKVQHSDT